MVIYDFSNIVIGQVMDYFRETEMQPDINLMRHIALQSILVDKDKRQKYHGTQGVILAFDGHHYWRSDIFPNYKQNRKAAQKKKVGFDFPRFYQDFNQIKEEFKANIPMRCIQVDGAEADDVIAVLAKKYAAHEEVCIIGSDKDFLQIQDWSTPFKVVQYSPWHKKFLTPENRDLTLIEHVCGGDKNDGIPNIWSDIDTFMTEGIRQKSFTKKLKEGVANAGFAGMAEFLDDDELLNRFLLNKKLIDLTEIPDEVSEAIIKAFDENELPVNKFHAYLVEHRLRKIMEMVKS